MGDPLYNYTGSFCNVELPVPGQTASSSTFAVGHGLVAFCRKNIFAISALVVVRRSRIELFFAIKFSLTENINLGRVSFVS